MADNLHVSDATLLRRVRRGDSVAFAELSRKHEPKILAVSRRILKNLEDAEDNAQSTFMRAYFHCGQFAALPSFPPGWCAWRSTRRSCVCGVASVIKRLV